MALADLSGKRVVVWGAGREAGAFIRATQRLNIECDLSVYNETIEGTELEGVVITDDVATLNSAEVIVLSPGVSRYKPEVSEAKARGVLVTSSTELWFQQGYENVIAVTGTKGKSTTASLVAHLLNGIGETAQLAGNIGRSPIDYVGVVTPKRWVLELSSFQTSGLSKSPDVGVLTSLSPEHLDWHGDYEHYRDDKLNLFAHNPSIVSVANGEDPGVRSVLDNLPNVVCVSTLRHIDETVGVRDGYFVLDDVELFSTDRLRLVGRHNLRLACLALTALKAAGIDIVSHARSLSEAMSSFEPLAHRLSPVAEIKGVTYVDDGLATTPIATMAAVDAFEGLPITVLVGGHDRGVSYDDLGAFLAERGDSVRVITMPANGGRIADAIERAVSNVDPDVHVSESLADAISIAARITPPTGVVLLSPAAASFGAFRDYVERSEAFIAGVLELQ